jgi:hypothetical protein
MCVNRIRTCARAKCASSFIAIHRCCVRVALFAPRVACGLVHRGAIVATGRAHARAPKARYPRAVLARFPRMVLARYPRTVPARYPRTVLARYPRTVLARYPRAVLARYPRDANGTTARSATPV